MVTHMNASQTVSLADSRLLTTYTALGWSDKVWQITSATSRPTHIPGIHAIPNAPPVLNAGELITLTQAKQQTTYTARDWRFGTVWAIREGTSFPLLISVGDEYIEGGPGQSIKWHVFVEIADDGTMYYNGEIYKSLRNGIKVSMFEGETGEVVKHVWGGPKIPDNQGKVHTFLASGVQDPDYPGGYGHYTDETTRTVTLREDRSINVNFYYIDAGLPSYNYLLRIAAPDGVAHLAIMKDDVSEIKVQMHDGSVCTLDIVPLDDVQASPIRVMTTNGIFALKKIELFD